MPLHTGLDISLMSNYTFRLRVRSCRSGQTTNDQPPTELVVGWWKLRAAFSWSRELVEDQVGRCQCVGGRRRAAAAVRAGAALPVGRGVPHNRAAASAFRTHPGHRRQRRMAGAPRRRVGKTRRGLRPPNRASRRRADLYSAPHMGRRGKQRDPKSTRHNHKLIAAGDARGIFLSTWPTASTYESTRDGRCHVMRDAPSSRRRSRRERFS